MGRDMDEAIGRDPAAIHALGVVGRDDGLALDADGDQAGADLVRGQFGQHDVGRPFRLSPL
jgi:hypothetical protein